MKETKIVRIGTVSSTNPETATVKVVFSDIDNMVTTDLPVIVPQGIKNKYYAMPDVGENVLCIFIGQGVGDGFCLGCFYTPSVIPPVSNQNKVHYAFEDGTFIEYDREEHKLTADVNGDADVKVKKIKIEATDIEATCDNLKGQSKNVEVSCLNLSAISQDATIQANNVELVCEKLDIKASGEVFIKGSKITLKGTVMEEVIS